MTTDSDIAAVEDAERALTEAILRDDADAFGAFFAPDCLVHAPNNKINTAADSIALMRAGVIAYSSFEHRVEHRARLGDYVVTMGEETLVPKGSAPNAGKTVRRRFTDIWGKVDGKWLLKLRQATIIGVA
jgi:ketosteroid isomerase-like protein